MSKEKRDRLLRRVGVELGRELTTQTHFLHALIASKAGLNSTDARCLEFLSRAGADFCLTAGDLTKATGLTTGAITGILDRLEAAGLVERVRDSSDRRKVFIRVRPEADERFGRLYNELGDAMMKLALSYSTKELEIIGGFLEKNLAILQEHIVKLS